MDPARAGGQQWMLTGLAMQSFMCGRCCTLRNAHQPPGHQVTATLTQQMDSSTCPAGCCSRFQTQSCHQMSTGMIAFAQVSKRRMHE